MKSSHFWASFVLCLHRLLSTIVSVSRRRFQVSTLFWFLSPCRSPDIHSLLTLAMFTVFFFFFVVARSFARFLGHFLFNFISILLNQFNRKYKFICCSLHVMILMPTRLSIALQCCCLWCSWWL